MSTRQLINNLNLNLNILYTHETEIQKKKIVFQNSGIAVRVASSRPTGQSSKYLYTYNINVFEHKTLTKFSFAWVITTCIALYKHTQRGNLLSASQIWDRKILDLSSFLGKKYILLLTKPYSDLGFGNICKLFYLLK